MRPALARRHRVRQRGAAALHVHRLLRARFVASEMEPQRLAKNSGKVGCAGCYDAVGAVTDGAAAANLRRCACVAKASANMEVAGVKVSLHYFVVHPESDRSCTSLQII